MRLIPIILTALVVAAAIPVQSASAPVRFAIVGLTHDHARGFIPAALARQDIQLVGIVEPNQELAARYAKDYRFNTNILYASLEEVLAKGNVQAVAAFTSTFDHRRVVEACAARGVHVMMEKPLAVSLEHARAIEAAARKGGIQVVVNYETTWYPANHAAYALIQEKNGIGDLRKIVVHDGHQGPKEIGCSAVFLEWLTDPGLNGGGALTDFGCYGADLITWLMNLRDGRQQTGSTGYVLGAPASLPARGSWAFAGRDAGAPGVAHAEDCSISAPGFSLALLSWLLAQTLRTNRGCYLLILGLHNHHTFHENTDNFFHDDPVAGGSHYLV